MLRSAAAGGIAKRPQAHLLSPRLDAPDAIGVTSWLGGDSALGMVVRL